jgi:hypothetical protein
MRMDEYGHFGVLPWIERRRVKPRFLTSPFELKKIERLVAERGITYKTSRGAKKHLNSL